MKKVFLIAASLFLVWQTITSLPVLLTPKSMSWTLALVLAFLANLYITGIFAFAGFALPTQRLLPDSYYAVKHPKRWKRLYQTWQVDKFQRFLLATFWRNKDQRKRFFDGKKGGLEHFETHSRKAEFGHLLPFIILTGLGLYLVFYGNFKLAFLLLLFNVLGNLYPILLQRHHRMRISVILKRRAK